MFRVRRRLRAWLRIWPRVSSRRRGERLFSPAPEEGGDMGVDFWFGEEGGDSGDGERGDDKVDCRL